jgi:hypothetical protein
MARGTGCPKESDEGKPVRELTGLSGDVDKKLTQKKANQSHEREKGKCQGRVCVRGRDR